MLSLQTAEFVMDQRAEGNDAWLRVQSWWDNVIDKDFAGPVGE